MPDTTVNVQAIWTLEDRASSGMAGVTRGAETASRAVSGVSGMLQRFEKISAAALGVGLASFGIAQIGKLIGRIAGIGSAAEQSRLQIGSMLWQAQQSGAVTGMNGFRDALDYAGSVGSKLSAMASRGVGETAEYRAAWQSVVLPVTRAGGSIQDTLDLTEQLVPLSKAYGVSVEEAGGSVLRLLSGQAMLRSRFVQLLGVDEAKRIASLAKTNPAQALSELNAVMARGQDASGAAGNTLAGAWSTATDAGKRMLKDVIVPLLPAFQSLVRLMIKFLDLPPIRLAISALKMLSGALGAVVNGLSSGLGRLFKPFEAWGKAVDRGMGRGPDLSGIQTVQRSASEAMRTASELGDGLTDAADSSGAAADGLSAVADASASAAGELSRIKTQQPKGLEEVQRIAAFLRGSPKYSSDLLDPHAGGPPATAAELLDQAYQVELLRRQREGRRGISLGEFAQEWTRRENAAADAAGSRVLDLGGGAYLPLTPQIATVHNAAVDWAKDSAASMGVKAPRNLLEVYERFPEAADLFGEAMAAAIKRSVPEIQSLDLARELFKRSGLLGEKPTIVQDFRGSHVELKVDARHQDPDRVAASVFNALERAADRPTQAATDLFF